MYGSIFDRKKRDRSIEVAILGVSLGGPAALQFALRHKDICGGLIMQDAVSHEYHPSQEAEKSIIGRLFLSPMAGKH
jgi:pimeloyl-ACP methyl ester carboxylesterase